MMIYAGRLRLFFCLLFLLIFPSLVLAQKAENDTSQTKSTSFQKNAIKLNINCSGCNYGYIKTHISFVDFVRDQNDADVYLYINSNRTASGGREYTLNYLGQNRFEGQDDTLKYFSNQTDTRDDVRKGLLNKIEIGLMRYVSQTNMSKYIKIQYKQKGALGQQASNDKWDHWVFNIGGNTHFNFQKTQKGFALRGNLSAERITDAWKIQFRFHGNYNWNKYIFSDSTTESVYTNGEFYSGLFAKSLTPHWSLGLYSNAYSSTYSNIDYSVGVSPALEFNVFPYSEYTVHEFYFRYTLAPYYSQYNQETIYLKTKQMLLKQALIVHYDITKPWGNIEGDVQGSNYFYDFTKHRVDIHFSFNIHVFKGLSVYLYSHYAIINDQISLPAGTATTSDVLLNLREQATSYAFNAYIGLNYTFGSIFNNIVNPRF